METVKDYINKLPKGQPISLRFLETIEYEKGIPFLKITAIKAIKRFKYKLLKEEVFKASIYAAYSKNLYWAPLSGYSVFFREEQNKFRSAYAYGANSYDTRWSSCIDGWYPKISYKIPLYSKKEFVQVFKMYAPYLILDVNTIHNDPLDYVKRFIKEPKIENLIKNGIGYLYRDNRVLKLDGDRLKRFATWCKQNFRYIQKNKPNYVFINRCINNGMMCGEKMESFQIYLTIQRCLKEFNYSINDCKEIKKYLDRQNCLNTNDYRDYLRMSATAKRNITDRGVRFPHDFYKQHDALSKMARRKFKCQLNEKITNVYQCLKQLQLVDAKNQLKIVIPQCQRDFVALGERLHNCVGSSGYDEKVAKKECIILAVYKIDEPVECCELVFTKSKSIAINQLRGTHNQDSAYHESAKKLINKFIRAYKPGMLLAQVGA